MTEPSQRQRTAVLIVAYDSQYKWARRIGRALERLGVTCAYAICTDYRHSISAGQLGEALPHEVPQLLSKDVLLDRLIGSDIAVFGIQGPVTSALTAELVGRAQGRAGSASAARAPESPGDSNARPRTASASDIVLPVMVTGWVGVIIEKIVAGYLERFTSDVIAVNSRADLRTFESTAHSLGLGTDNLLLSGLPLLPARRTPLASGPISTVLFADQPTVPGPVAERTYLYRRLADYARTHPDRRVILKPRHRPDEDTFHRMDKHPETLLAGLDLPENFTVDYTPISQQLDTIDLMLTVSSTAALESLGHGVRTSFVLDLGVHERLGNQIFIDSGLLRTFDQLIADDTGAPTDEFLDDYFLDPPLDPVDAIAARAVQLTDVPSAQRPSRAAIASDYFAGVVAVRAFREAQSAAATAAEAAATGRASARSAPIRVQFDNSLRSRAKALALVVLPTGWLDRARRRYWTKRAGG